MPGGPTPEKTAPQMEDRAVSERPATPARGEAVARRVNDLGGTVIGEDTIFQGGKIVSKGTLRIDGQVEGEIVAEDRIIIGPTGCVRANLAARHVAVSGKVFGNIVAFERLELQPTSEVHGDVQTSAGALIIEGGARLDGKCIMSDPEAVRRQQARQAGAEGRPAEGRPAEARSPEGRPAQPKPVAVPNGQAGKP